MKRSSGFRARHILHEVNNYTSQVMLIQTYAFVSNCRMRYRRFCHSHISGETNKIRGTDPVLNMRMSVLNSKQANCLITDRTKEMMEVNWQTKRTSNSSVRWFDRVQERCNTCQIPT